MRFERMLYRRATWMALLCMLSAGGCASILGIEDLPEVRDGGNPPGDLDARVSPIDAGDSGQPDPTCTPWPFQPEHFDPCGPSRPLPGLTPLVLGIDGIYIYNTDNNLLLDPSGAPVLPPPVTFEEGGVQAIWAESVTIESGSTLRVEGAKPLMIISTGDILMSGIIDVSSSWEPDSKTFDRGAGAEPVDCAATAPQIGGECQEGGGGGGGGGFGGGGGAGGVGANGRNCGPAQGVPGGNGGRNLTSAPTKIRGGCAGERGGKGDGDMLYGVGGAGGGAVHLVSQTQIDIEGRIHAGGAAGAGAENKRSGGGGGGSGGFIGLEAPDIEIDQTAILAANGGGGGGGTNNSQQPSGQDGQLSNQAATGGTGNAGGNGGPGSAGISRNGQPGGDGDRGGGGSGGGAGYIVVYQANPRVASGATISPPHTRQ